LLGVAAAAVEDQDNRRRFFQVILGRDMDEIGPGPLVHFEGAGVVAGTKPVAAGSHKNEGDEGKEYRLDFKFLP
jgi:hypothetical protein